MYCCYLLLLSHNYHLFAFYTSQLFCKKGNTLIFIHLAASRSRLINVSFTYATPYTRIVHTIIIAFSLATRIINMILTYDYDISQIKLLKVSFSNSPQPFLHTMKQPDIRVLFRIPGTYRSIFYAPYRPSYLEDSLYLYPKEFL